MSGALKHGRIVNKAVLANLLNISLPTVDDWRRRGCPAVEEGGRGREYQYDVSAVVQWRVTTSVADALSGYHDDSGAISKDEADRRRSLATAITAEVTADEALDVVVRRHDAEADVAAFCLVLKSGLSNASSKIAARAAGITSAPEIEELCQSEMNRAFGAARGELARRWSGESGEGSADHGEDQPSPER